MTEEVKTEKKQEEEKQSKSQWTKEERDLFSNYGCQLLVENATEEQQGDRAMPTDASVIWYKVGDQLYKDMVRGPRVNLFDLYFDKFGKGAIQKIDYGKGTVNPARWGYKAPVKKKRRKP